MKTDGKTRAKILNALCLTGQYPLSQYALISDEETSPNAIYRMLLIMREEKQITIQWRGGYRKKKKKSGNRKTEPGKKSSGAEKVAKISMRRRDKDGNSVMEKTIQELIGREPLEHFYAVTDSRKQSSRPSYIMRGLRKAEAMVTLRNSGAGVFPHEKPKLEDGGWNTEEAVYYYDSIEIKDSGLVKEGSYARSRFLGILFSPGGVYVVYNFKKNNMQLTQTREMALRNAMQDLAMIQSKRNTGSAYPDVESAIIFGHDDNQVLDRVLLWEQGAFAELCKTYDKLHYFPITPDAAFQAWMLSQPNWRERLLRGMIVESYLEKENMYRTYDAYIPDQNLKVLSWVDANLVSLRLISADLKRNPDQNYALICLPWQEEIVRKYLGNKVQVMSISQDSIKEILKKEG